MAWTAAAKRSRASFSSASRRNFSSAIIRLVTITSTNFWIAVAFLAAIAWTLLFFSHGYRFLLEVLLLRPLLQCDLLPC